MSDPKPTDLVRVYVDRATAERLDAEAARITGALGRFVRKSRIYSVVIAAGLAHEGEVIAALETEA